MPTPQYIESTVVIQKDRLYIPGGIQYKEDLGSINVLVLSSNPFLRDETTRNRLG